VILEIDLLSLNGVEATRQIKRDRPSTEVLVYTTHNEERVIGEALRAGARGYVLKSDNEDKLVEAITALARHVPFFSPSAAETMLTHLIKFGPNATEMLPLTAREREIVCLLSDAKSNKQIASQLRISVKTVETHRAAVMRKLGFKSITDLVRYAIRNGFVEP
jgi:DNA-binding NarL/FixJ family response regulator